MKKSQVLLFFMLTIVSSNVSAAAAGPAEDVDRKVYAQKFQSQFQERKMQHQFLAPETEADFQGASFFEHNREINSRVLKEAKIEIEKTVYVSMGSSSTQIMHTQDGTIFTKFFRFGTDDLKTLSEEEVTSQTQLLVDHLKTCGDRSIVLGNSIGYVLRKDAPLLLGLDPFQVSLDPYPDVEPERFDDLLFAEQHKGVEDTAAFNQRLVRFFTEISIVAKGKAHLKNRSRQPKFDDSWILGAAAQVPDCEFIVDLGGGSATVYKIEGSKYSVVGKIKLSANDALKQAIEQADDSPVSDIVAKLAVIFRDIAGKGSIAIFQTGKARDFALE